VLQPIRCLLDRSLCFRPERKLAGSGSHRRINRALQGTHNNLCERALKKAILHRKNALFYRTRNGAQVGDLFMSLIHTAELHQVEPFDYLVALLRHAAAVALDPAAWMPWNYTAALAHLASETSDPTPD
jgi:transposase